MGYRIFIDIIDIIDSISMEFEVDIIYRKDEFVIIGLYELEVQINLSEFEK
jgi:hypothetical protein